MMPKLKGKAIKISSPFDIPVIKREIAFNDLFGSVEKKVRRLVSKRANELDGKTWLQYSISIWSDISKTTEEVKLKHPAMFPKELPKRIMKIFLTEDEKKILDPFVGIGSTLVASQELGKEGVGFEISEEYAKIAKQRLKTIGLFSDKNIMQTIYVDDARNMTEYLEKESIDICITSPPYWDILSEKRTADQKIIKDYHKKDGNLADIHDYKKFLTELKNIFQKVFIVLKKGAYCVVEVMDIRKKDKYYPFHVDIMKFMQEIGFVFDDLIIWDRRKEYNNLRPLGYPFVFRVNKVHEYILIFFKPSK